MYKQAEDARAAMLLYRARRIEWEKDFLRGPHAKIWRKKAAVSVQKRTTNNNVKVVVS